MKTISDVSGHLFYSTSLYGNYAVIKPNNNDIGWLTRCRVEFEWYLKSNGYHNRIGFHRKNDFNIVLIRSFWRKIFAKLGKESKFTIHTCNFPNMCVIDLPPFWNDTDTARSLFSLLLRVSVCHYKKGDTILKALKSYSLASKVIPAIEWYLQGNTKPTYETLTKRDREGYVGFVAEFENATEVELKQKLVS